MQRAARKKFSVSLRQSQRISPCRVERYSVCVPDDCQFNIYIFRFSSRHSNHVHFLDAALVRMGWPADDRPFRAHLTIARSDGSRAGPRLARRLMAAADGFSAVWEAGSLVLFESLTGGGPARYLPIVTAPLGG